MLAKGLLDIISQTRFKKLLLQDNVISLLYFTDQGYYESQWQDYKWRWPKLLHEVSRTI